MYVREAPRATTVYRAKSSTINNSHVYIIIHKTKTDKALVLGRVFALRLSCILILLDIHIACAREDRAVPYVSYYDQRSQSNATCICARWVQLVSHRVFDSL